MFLFEKKKKKKKRCKVKNTAHYVADALDMKTSPLCYSGI